jgi:surface protein
MYAGVTDWSSIGNITGWNTSCITSMTGMFYRSNFNQPISNWNTSSVTDMNSMFSESIFNQSLSGWDTSNVVNMGYMFDGDNSFDQDLSSWNITSVEIVEGMFQGVNLSIDNYDALLNSWSNQSVYEGFYGASFDAGSSMYSSNGQNGRNTLVNYFGWNIIDGGYYAVAENIPSPASGSSSGSNGGSSGAGFVQTVQCKENWKCDAWSACSKYGLRIRTCTDLNNCSTSGTTTNKPAISQVCDQKAYNTTIQNPKKALFDIITEIITEPRNVGEDLVAKISLINFGLKGKVNANLHYKILDNNNLTVKEFNETVPVQTQTEFLKHINTSGLLKGKYTLVINLTYLGQTEPASSEKIFYINEGLLQRLFRIIGFDAIILSIILAGLLILGYIGYRRIVFRKKVELSLKIGTPKPIYVEYRIRPGKESDVHEHIAQNVKVIAVYNKEIKNLMEINQTLEKNGFVESAEKIEKKETQKKPNIVNHHKRLIKKNQKSQERDRHKTKELNKYLTENKK